MYLCLKVQSKQFSSGIRGSIAYSFFFSKKPFAGVSRICDTFIFSKKYFTTGDGGGSREIHGLVSCGSLTHSFFNEIFRGGFAGL